VTRELREYTEEVRVAYSSAFTGRVSILLNRIRFKGFCSRDQLVNEYYERREPIYIKI